MVLQKLGNEVFDLLRGNETKSGASVGSALVCHDTSFFEPGTKVFNYFHGIIEQDELSLLRAKTTDIVQDMVLSHFSIE